jgi:hypothetical protein
VGGIVSTGLAVTSFGSQKEGELPVVSLSAKEEPLRKVLDKISRASGYEITLNGESGDLLVSITFKNAALGEALKRVLRDLNYTAIWDEENKKISLTIYDLRAEKNIKTQPGISYDKANPRVLIRPPSKTKKGSGATVSDTSVSGTNEKRLRQNQDFEVSITGKNRTFVQGSKTTID